MDNNLSLPAFKTLINIVSYFFYCSIYPFHYNTSFLVAYQNYHSILEPRPTINLIFLGDKEGVRLRGQICPYIGSSELHSLLVLHNFTKARKSGNTLHVKRMLPLFRAVVKLIRIKK